VTDLTSRAIDLNAAQLALGNETYELAAATFVRNRDTPNIYDANHVTNIRASTSAEIDELLAAVEREFAHTNHRRFSCDYRTPPGFIARLALDGGYEQSDALVMLFEGELVGNARPCDIRAVLTDADWEDYWNLMILDWNEHNARGKRDADEDIARQMWRAKKRKQPPVQNWFACDGERPVAYFNSWEGIDGVGQVEDLFCHPDYRKRGFATALLHHCVRESRAKGAGPVAIVADPTDTPKNIYARMGWRPVAVASGYLKKLGEQPA